MPAYTDVKDVVNGLVALIKQFVEVMKSFIDGFQKKLTFGKEEEAEG